jgi:hypothetical protein
MVDGEWMKQNNWRTGPDRLVIELGIVAGELHAEGSNAVEAENPASAKWK